MCLYITYRAIKLNENFQIFGHFASPSPIPMRLTCVQLTTWDAIVTLETDTLERNWHFLINCEMQLVRVGWQLGKQLIHMKQTPWDATDMLSQPLDANHTSPWHGNWYSETRYQYSVGKRTAKSSGYWVKFGTQVENCIFGKKFTSGR